MTDKPRSRHIPKKVVTQLLEAQRHRCCVRSPVCGGVLLDPGNYDPETLAETLDRHHIVMFSEGGEHTYNNLVLACDNCHEQIHRHGDEYPPDVLRAKKEHWVGMRDVVPTELKLLGEGDDTIQVTFSMESVNLQYAITAPPDAKVGDLALLVRDEILRPLGRYDGNKTWAEAERVKLARRSAPEEENALAPGLPLSGVQLEPDDALVAHIATTTIPVFVPPIPDLFGKDEGDERTLEQEVVTEPRLREVTPEPEPVVGRPVWERRYPFEPEMVFVPAGEFWMGSDRKRLERAGIEWGIWMENVLPQHKVTLPNYWIAKYPVTNAEYRAFIEDRGYRTRAYWTEAGWKWKGERKRPYYWNDERYNGPRQPVVGVSWYEAVAYCRWLSEKTGLTMRLPSEAEWEKAARGTDGRIWPWGDEEPDANRCNFAMNVGKPTPVGQYSPAGDSSYGCADMVGNVQEWCATKWEDSYKGYEGDDDLEGDARRVFRGGSYLDLGWRARCAYRYAYYPLVDSFALGFRVCVTVRQE